MRISILLLVFLSSVVFSIRPVAANGPVGISTDVLLWLDASDIDGDNDPSNDPADGDLISVWVDKSGNGNDATAIFNPATFRSDSANLINGAPVVRFTRFGCAS